MSIRINEIFESISGEAGGFLQGSWCTFIRTQKCNLHCSWCDTQRARLSGGEEFSIEDILQRVVVRGNKQVLITGGEPLLQDETPNLINVLLNNGFKVQVETNGSYPVSRIWPASVHWVFDYKCPSSGMTERMMPLEVFSDTLKGLASAYLKFVIEDEKDIIHAVKTSLELLDYGVNIPLIFSPINAQGEIIPKIVQGIKDFLPPIKASRLLEKIIFSVQLQKIYNLP